MKKDLATTIGLTIIGVLVAYFVCNMFVPPIESVTIKDVEGSIDLTLEDPNPEVFNYRAINPTVEVYVGDCTEVDADGKCLDQNPGGE